jgi:hypothetical protein
MRAEQMNTNSAILKLYLTNPTEAIRSLIDNPPHFLVIFIFLLAMLNDHVASAMNLSLSAGILTFYLTFGFLIKVATVLCLLVVVVSLVHFWTDLTGRAGSVGSLFMVFMLSFLPLVFAMPAHFLAGRYRFLLTIVLGLWIVYLQLRSIQVIYRLSTGWAILLIVFTGLFLAVLLPLLGSSIAVGLIVSLSGAAW